MLCWEAIADLTDKKYIKFLNIEINVETDNSIYNLMFSDPKIQVNF